LLQPTNIAQAIATALEAFDQLVPLLHLDTIDFQSLKLVLVYIRFVYTLSKQPVDPTSMDFDIQGNTYLIYPLSKMSCNGWLNIFIVLDLIKLRIMLVSFV
jgi:hypothetical protein